MIPIDRLHHVNVVVKDLRATAVNYARLYGIERWAVARHTADRLRDTSAFGFATPFTYATATGSNSHGVTFRLVKPTAGMSTFAERLITRGEGIHGMCPAVLSADAFERLRGPLAEAHIGIGQAATVDGARHYWLDTRCALGGFFVEVVVPAAPGAQIASRVDEEWDLSSEARRSAGLDGFRDVGRIFHFGVAVEALMGRLPAYARVLGLNDWTFTHFEPRPGSLDSATLNGRPVEYASLLALAGVADFGFELLQTTFGPTHFQEEMLDRFGEGIHHLLLLPGETEERWPLLRAEMEGMGAPVAMSGVVRGGAAEYRYFDTRGLLGGYLTEAIVRHGSAPRGEPDYRFNFSERVY